MSQIITGLHHVTALASDAQLNVDFYAGILGLRMVKKTINFDAPDVYHLYYGNEQGAPGTIMTFFPYHGIVQGCKGKGQLTVTSFSIPVNALDYWMKRLRKFNLNYTPPQERFAGEQFIYFEDNDGLGIELVANDQDLRPGFSHGQIPLEYAVKGFYGVSLAEDGFERTAGLLIDQMNHKLIAQKDDTYRFSASGLPGDFVDIIASPESSRGISGAGTVHHLAFATPSDHSQLEMREKLLGQFNVTPVLDRQYFHSIYFREPGGILFEVATHPPGFAVDEALAHLGEALKLPSWVEPQRESIEKGLVPIVLQPEKFMDQ
ncbi:ring-cleaving dioxygenase [Haliscomenobacter hydrossis]|uniref:Glyoxalase/bleomycin resistance protein/dioxygenase n=1 Tax=Haliscomenobacter hydrossis (strain ATCC 27775 / DSM 1100 / LMG 10767 / O) TaxID=760192 RepID=F4L333_HALH1|nr:ring-cleaving dioxygenase [Haliscomenobacter hydrossis]AEE50692.1 Glyoxalase/bleomycin resistance protein/dioxygenase [Haliscomenobacter hydrossis DSM 1100]